MTYKVTVKWNINDIKTYTFNELECALEVYEHAKSHGLNVNLYEENKN